MGAASSAVDLVGGGVVALIEQGPGSVQDIGELPGALGCDGIGRLWR
ncbi:hypothetical protein [Streptacidiphilus neutrinimicus]|nr:hypothetical protein [Streptacidiphilus neutrinimicus]